MLNKLTGITILLVSLAALSIGIYLLNNNKKVSFIKTQEVFNEFKLKKELEKKLENETTMQKKYLDSTSFALQMEAKRLEMEPENESKIKDFLMRKEEFLNKKEMFVGQHQQLTSKYDEQILKQMNQFIEDYGREKKIDFVFGASGNGNLMYASEANDITKDVIKYINERYDGK